MQSRTNMLLVAVLATLLVALLVGQRLGFGWAGGAGYAAPQTITVHELEGTATAHALGTTRELKRGGHVYRGERIETTDATYLELRFQNGSRLALDANTDATLEASSEAEIAVRMTHGRLIAEAAPTRRFIVRTNETESVTLAGSFTVIDEADRAVAHIIPLGSPVAVIVHRVNGFVATTPQEVHEIAPYEVTNGSYRLVNSAADFYTRFGINPSR